MAKRRQTRQILDDIPADLEVNTKSSRSMPVEKLVPNPFQPRIAYPEKEMRELERSIAEQGLLNPVVVTKLPDSPPGVYTIVAGHRRYYACVNLGETTIPVTEISGVDETGLRLLALTENLIRQDLDLIEEAHALRDLVEILGSQDEVAKRLGISRGAVTKKISLRKLDPKIVEDIRENETTNDYTSLSMIASLPAADQWKYYRGLLEHGRAWLTKELRKKKSGPEPIVLKGVMRGVPGKSLTISSRAIQKLNREKMKKLGDYLQRLLEE